MYYFPDPVWTVYPKIRIIWENLEEAILKSLYLDEFKRDKPKHPKIRHIFNILIAYTEIERSRGGCIPMLCRYFHIVMC